MNMNSSLWVVHEKKKILGSNSTSKVSSYGEECPRLYKETIIHSLNGGGTV